VLAEATAACRRVNTLSVEVAVSGTASGRRVRARLLAGLAPPASARLEAYAFGQPIFVFAARDGAATLLLTRDARVLERGEPAAVLEALTGIPLDTADLRPTLLGCPVAPEPSAGRRFGDEWRVITDRDGYVYVRRDAATWRLLVRTGRARDGSEWRAEYRDFRDGLPTSVRLITSGPGSVDLRLTLSGLELNPVLPPQAFEVRIPAGAQPIALQELRARGPLDVR
jgi:hypothetical protein